MKTDLDRLMGERGLSALLIIGEAPENVPLRYMTNGAPISGSMVLKQVGMPPVLLTGPMERDEAAKSGLQVLTTAEFELPKLLKETKSYFEAQVRMTARFLERFAVAGKVGVYGLADAGRTLALFTRLGEMLPGIRFVGEPEGSLFDEAYITKDEAELVALKSAAERTNQAMQYILGWLAAHPSQADVLLKADGTPLTIGDVKGKLRARLAELGLQEVGGTIFAQGRDAGVPHSRGDDAAPVRQGLITVFDLFPRDSANGCFHDMTRTFCLGYAPEAAQALYDDVLAAFNAVVGALRAGESTEALHKLVCDSFEANGHPTTRSRPGTSEGFVHSLGHGLGLEIHALPRFGPIDPRALAPGMVFTIEPGLYYPERGLGVRIEDTFFIDGDGAAHSLTPVSKDFVLPVGVTA